MGISNPKICIYTSMCIHLCPTIYLFYISTYIHIYTYVYICIHTYIHTYIYIYIHTYIHTYIYIYIYIGSGSTENSRKRENWELKGGSLDPNLIRIVRSGWINEMREASRGIIGKTKNHRRYSTEDSHDYPHF